MLKVFNGTTWTPVDTDTTLGFQASAVAPTIPAPVAGQLWVDITTPTAPVLNVFDGTNWAPVDTTLGFQASATAPTTPAPTAGQLWVDITTPTAPALKVFDGTNWVAVGGGGGGGVELIAADETIVVAPTGDDTTGDGSAATPFATLDPVIARLGSALIAAGVTVTIDATAFTASSHLHG